METKSIKLPGPTHPITIEPNPAQVTVTVEGHVVADSRNALTSVPANHAALKRWYEIVSRRLSAAA